MAFIAVLSKKTVANANQDWRRMPVPEHCILRLSISAETFPINMKESSDIVSRQAIFPNLWFIFTKTHSLEAIAETESINKRERD
jgi:hypothetical protein